MIEAIIFDYGGTVHDPETDQLRPGVGQLLDKLKPKFRLALVSKALDLEQRKADFKRFELDDYFEIMEVLPLEKTKDFTNILKQFAVNPSNTLVVGDYVQSEIVEGNKIGAVTVWLRAGEFPDQLPTTKEEQPDYTIESLNELEPIIDAINQK